MARAKLEGARTGKDSPSNERFKALVEEQKAIRTKQQSHKANRGTQQAQFDSNEETIKGLIKKQNDARQRLGFKNVEELDAQRARLQNEVDSGKMRLVDEKKQLQLISSLTKQRKEFDALTESQKVIDQKKAENAETRKTFDNPEARALAQSYEKNQKELDDIKASREDSNKSFDTLKAEREKLYNEQREAYGKIKQIKDEYFQQRKAHKEYEDTLYQQRRERQRAERDAYEKEKRKRIAEQRLEEAGEPAYLDQIRSAEGLIKHFDPSYGAQESEKGPGQFAAATGRTVDESGFKDMKPMKKVEEDFFPGSGGKKKGKGKKSSVNGASGSDTGKLNLNMGIIEQLGKAGVDPPSTQAGVPGVVEKLKEKVVEWKRDQDSQTQKVSQLLKLRREYANVGYRILTRQRKKSNDSRRRLQRHLHRALLMRTEVDVVVTIEARKYPNKSLVRILRFPPRRNSSRNRMQLPMLRRS